VRVAFSVACPSVCMTLGRNRSILRLLACPVGSVRVLWRLEEDEAPDRSLVLSGTGRVISAFDLRASNPMVLFCCCISALVLLAASAHATPLTITNRCSFNIDLWDNRAMTPLAQGASTFRTLPEGFSGMFRHGVSGQATCTSVCSVCGDETAWWCP
jgi:hypothetical protein